MINLSVLLRELSQLINANHLSDEQINRAKDIICYLSEGKKKNQIPGAYLQTVDFLLYTASVRLRTFGYNRLNDFKSDVFNDDETSKLKDECITRYYSTPTNFVLDKQQKKVLDAFEDSGKRLFLSAPTSFGKTFLLKEIIYRNYELFSNIVIVLPTVALLMEVTEDLTDFCDIYGLEYGIVNSIYRDLEIKEKNIFVLTPERVLRLLALYPDLKLDFFFYDEIYKIDEDFAIKGDDDISETIDIGENIKGGERKEEHNHRATAFRLALYFLLKKTEACYIAGPFIQVKGLQTGFVRMLERHNITPLEFSFEPTLKNKYHYGGKVIRKKSPFEEEKISTAATAKRDKLKCIIQHLGIDEGNQALVYCLFPGYTENYARDYCTSINDKPVNSPETALFIEHLKKNYAFAYGYKRKNSLDSWDFLYALEHNVGIHNGKFPKYFQREIMNLYNLKQFPLLFCTSTIVEGVNTSAKTVIIYNNPQGENEAGKKFLLLNINGRAGRYLRHFVGNIVYLDSKSIELEGASNIALDFKLYSEDSLLGELDLENASYEDLSEKNKDRQSKIVLNKEILPDDVFEQNRLIERRKQEKILGLLCRDYVFSLFKGIETASIQKFLDVYFENILKIWSIIGEIRETQIQAIKLFAKNYAQQGYAGVLKYKFDKYDGWHLSEKEDNDFVNETYKAVFKNVKDTIEYQIPRILSLFESLIDRAFVLKDCKLEKPLDLSKIIRYFEIGAGSELGIDMIERGVPIITVRKIEQVGVKGASLVEQKQYFKENIGVYMFRLDEYERGWIKKYLDK